MTQTAEASAWQNLSDGLDATPPGPEAGPVGAGKGKAGIFRGHTPGAYDMTRRAFRFFV